MLEIVLYLKEDFLIKRFSEFFKNYKMKITKESSDLKNLKDSILILKGPLSFRNNEVVIKKILNNNNKILLVENVPNLDNAKSMFKLGINAYGNTMMTKEYFYSAIDSMSKGFAWLIPEITSQIIKSLAINNEKDYSYLLDKLTKTEQKIAILIKNGYTNYKICHELNISINTIKTHIKHIYEKLDVKDRLEFINLFLN